MRNDFSITPCSADDGVLNLHLNNIPSGLYNLVIENINGTSILEEKILIKPHISINKIQLDRTIAGLFLFKLKNWVNQASMYKDSQ